MHSPLSPSIETSSLESPRRLLIVRLGAMGDIIHTLPAAVALRNALPDTNLGWLVEERWAELLCALSEPRSGPRSARRPGVDKIHTVNTRTWRKSPFSIQTWEQIAAGLSELRAPQYEVAVDFQGALRSALLARWSGAPVIYGFAQPRENVASMFYSRQVIARGRHIVQQNLSLAEDIVRHPLQLERAEFPQDAGTNTGPQSDTPFALMNPGAGWGAKQWPAERYGEVARELAKDGLRTLINCGPGEDNVVRAVEQASGGTAQRIACSITELIALTRRARLLIGGDTGPMHLAAALQIPVVAIFGPTDPARNGPFGTRSIVLRSPSSQTSHSHRMQPDQGLLTITSAEVVAAARELLRSSRG